MVRECKYCGKEFEPSKFHPKQTYCSNKCNQDDWYDKHRRVYSKRSDECKICGKGFVRKEKAYNQIYCSRRCNKIAYYRSPKGQIDRKNALKKVMFKYHHDKKFRDRWRKKCHKYATSKNGKPHRDEYRKKYRTTEIGKLADLKYRKSDKRKVSLNRYIESEKGRANGLKHSLKRRTRIKNVIHNFTYREWLQKVKDTFGICPRCDKYVGIRKITLDHIIPISKVEKEQVYTIDDVQPLCRGCNSSKNGRVEV